jgi:hypothetical protein
MTMDFLSCNWLKCTISYKKIIGVIFRFISFKQAQKILLFSLFLVLKYLFESIGNRFLFFRGEITRRIISSVEFILIFSKFKNNLRMST